MAQIFFMVIRYRVRGPGFLNFDQDRIYTVCRKEITHFYFRDNFGKYGLILLIFDHYIHR